MVDPARSESARHAPILDERWELLEARVDQLLQRIRPNRGSELRRARVAEYVRSLVARCFKSEVSGTCPACGGAAHHCLYVLTAYVHSQARRKV